MEAEHNETEFVSLDIIQLCKNENIALAYTVKTFFFLTTQV